MTRWALPLLFLAACGGEIFTGGDSGSVGNDASPGKDSAVGLSCPPSPPPSGGACAPANIQCEYGPNPDPSCNTVMECTSTGWANVTTGQLCPPVGPMCPATYASVPTGQDCTTSNLTCAYKEGVCICTQEFGGVARMTPGWDCFAAKPGCPNPRLNLGTACSQPGLDCNYGACSGGIDELCTGGSWQPQTVPCPK